jgi:hypothetical protein
MYKSFLVSTTFISLILSELPAQANIFDQVVGFGRAVTRRITNRSPVHNTERDRSVHDERVDVPLRKWVFHRYATESIDASSSKLFFESVTGTNLRFIPRSNKHSIGAAGLKDLFQQPQAQKKFSPLTVDEAQHLPDDILKLVLIDVWKGQLRADGTTPLPLAEVTPDISLPRTSQRYKETDALNTQSQPSHALQ